MDNEVIVETYKGIKIGYDKIDTKAPYYVKQNLPVIGVLETCFESIEEARKFIETI